MLNDLSGNFFLIAPFPDHCLLVRFDVARSELKYTLFVHLMCTFCLCIVDKIAEVFFLTFSNETNVGFIQREINLSHVSALMSNEICSHSVTYSQFFLMLVKRVIDIYIYITVVIYW